MQKRMALLKAQKAFAEDPARAAKLVQRCFRLARAGLLLRRDRGTGRRAHYTGARSSTVRL